MKTYQYKAYGIIFESELVLPELIPVTDQDSDVYIKYGTVPDHLPNIKGSGVLYESSPGDFIFKLDSVAKYRVRNGAEIIVDPNSTASLEEIRLFLLGPTLGALIHQRGLLPISGSAIAVSNGGLIISGESASGKSTLTAALSIKGYRILSDDITVVSSNNEGNFKIYPGIPHLKLWKDVIDQLGLNYNYSKARPQLEKFILPLDNKFHDGMLTPKNIVVLSSKNNKDFTYESLFGIEKFNLLKENTYRYHFLEGLGLTKKHFETLSLFTNQIYLSRIGRPSSPFMLNELVELIEKKLIELNA